MASILDPEQTTDFKALAQGIRKALPSYARPIFIRILGKLDLTGTYKLKKLDLQKEGYNPSTISDNIYYLDATSGEYQPLTQEIYNKINDGTIRLWFLCVIVETECIYCKLMAWVTYYGISSTNQVLIIATIIFLYL